MSLYKGDKTKLEFRVIAGRKYIKAVQLHVQRNKVKELKCKYKVVLRSQLTDAQIILALHDNRLMEIALTRQGW